MENNRWFTSIFVVEIVESLGGLEGHYFHLVLEILFAENFPDLLNRTKIMVVKNPPKNSDFHCIL